jgi:CBS domain containing-hemolysin-like protein
MSQLGRIAAVGDQVDVVGGKLSVTRMDGRRIDRICFKPSRVPGGGLPAGQEGAA